MTFASALLFAISGTADALAVAGQLAAICLAVFVGRFVVGSRPWIWFVASAGSLAAMTVDILVDGQGAVFLLALTPIIYCLAVFRRRDFR